MPPDDRALAQQQGFAQFIDALPRHLNNAPLGWLLVLGLSWNQVATPPVLVWMGSALAVGLPFWWQAHRLARRGGLLRQDERWAHAITVVDAGLWGLSAWVLAGQSPVIDAWMITLVCGLATLSGVVYLPFLKAFYSYLGALWLGVASSTILRGTPDARLLIGAALFFVLLVLALRPVARRLEEGRLHEIAHDRLAERLQASLVQKEHEAATDGLTGLLNRRSLDHLLAQQVRGVEGPPRRLAVLMLDIDHFKRVNDTLGHPVGDRTLQAFAQRIQQQLRTGDLCARYGGEEFAVLLPGATLAVACEVAERLRQSVQATPLLSDPLVDNTVSIGVSTALESDTPQSLLKRADEALYRAKSDGRNRVCSDPAAAPPVA
ncbi:GGDEF domain-containing protein [Inhella gelatinilytica]|uniref:diguanylate cyclase n=1 Tax=Inhella gelatinilytica TaxID=2795030 RepID=A0A931N9S5_9BURK|nr:GGDEF domain-containing protein [Inhella gelatinilytica]MBH9551673.1 GGDEF domain-containing protein [Inhella gelatinilytica]